MVTRALLLRVRTKWQVRNPSAVSTCSCLSVNNIKDTYYTSCISRFIFNQTNSSVNHPFYSNYGFTANLNMELMEYWYSSILKKQLLLISYLIQLLTLYTVKL